MLVGLNSIRFENQQNLSFTNNKKTVSSPRASLHQLNQDKFEYTNARKNNLIYFGSNNTKSNFSVTAMAPLHINNDIEMANFVKDLQFGKANGVNTISVDVWWGIAEKAGEQKFDWKYYEKIFKTIKDNGLKITPILSMHQCGGNVGDNVNIPIPEWTWDYLATKMGANQNLSGDAVETAKTIGRTLKEDLYYKNERGQNISEVVPIWYDEVMMPKYKQFMKGFNDHFISNFDSQINIKDNIDEIHISCGPAGELRYPTYSENLQGAEFPSRGWFVGYDKGGTTSFRKYIEKKYNNDIHKLNYDWETKLGSFSEILPPHNNPVEEGRAKGFVDAKDYVNTKYGKDYIEWYHNTLIKHGEDLLINSHEIFKDTEIPIGIKIPGIHWQIANMNTPRIAEIVAGQVDNNTSREFDFGYKGFFDMIKSVKDRYAKNDTITYFTCLEMDNDLKGNLNGKQTNSMAKSLVEWVLDAAKSRGLTIKGENACESNLQSEKAWNMLKYNSWEGYDGVTFLRLGALNNNKHFQDFMNWVKGDLIKKARQVFKNAA